MAMARMYHIDSIREELNACVEDLQDGEMLTTFVRRVNKFMSYDLKMFRQQLALWRRQRAVCLRSNIREVEIAGRKMWLFVIQPRVMREDDSSSAVCPLSLSLGSMVSGYGYITTKKEYAYTVCEALGE